METHNNMNAVATRTVSEFWSKLDTQSLRNILHRIEAQAAMPGALPPWYEERRAEIAFINAELARRGEC